VVLTIGYWSSVPDYHLGGGHGIGIVGQPTLTFGKRIKGRRESIPNRNPSQAQSVIDTA